MSRRKAREYAFKVLFQVDQVGADPQKALEYLLEDSNLAEKDHDFCMELIQESIRHLGEIDDLVGANAGDWELERMPAVDKNIMRLAACEILMIDTIDPVIVIDEAIEIAKKYGGESSPAYVNAVLDKLMGDRE